MYTKYFAFAFGALPFASASLFQRGYNDPAEAYLTSMCYPLYSNSTRRAELKLSFDEMIPSLAFSPFPCEQSIYLQQICTANGTTVNDFLAEQECLCQGSFFTVVAGCNDCQLAHGYKAYTPEEASSKLSSLSVAECAPTPPFQPYINLVGRVNITSASLSPPLTLGVDKFPNMTAVSNYFTETASVTPGTITGSATARLTSWTNTAGNIFTPSSIPPNSGTGSLNTVSTTSSGSTSQSTSQSTNLATTRGVGIVGGVLAAGIGVLAML